MPQPPASDEIHLPLFAAIEGIVNTRANFLFGGKCVPQPPASDEIHSPLFAAIEGVGTMRLV